MIRNLPSLSARLRRMCSGCPPEASVAADRGTHRFVQVTFSHLCGSYPQLLSLPNHLHPFRGGFIVLGVPLVNAHMTLDWHA